MKNQILSYLAMMMTVAVMSYGWKYGTQIVERVHGLARRAAGPLVRRLPKFRTRKRVEAEEWQRLVGAWHRERNQRGRKDFWIPGLAVVLLLLLALSTDAFAQHLTFDEKIAAQTGLVRYHVMDSGDAFAAWGNDIASFRSGTEIPNLRFYDPSELASGKPSLKFRIPPGNGSDTSGNWTIRYSTDTLTQFGENTVHWVQYMVKLRRYLFEHNFTNSNGFKFGMIGRGDEASCTPQNANSSICATSATDIELVIQNNEQRGLPQMYNSSLTFRGFQVVVPGGGGDYDVQPRQGTSPAAGTYCSHYETTGNNNFANCFRYSDGLVNPSDESTRWATVTQQVTLGPIVTDNYASGGPGTCGGQSTGVTHCFQASNIKAWIHWMGDASASKFIDYTTDLVSSGTMKYGRLWLTPYQSNNADTTHDETFIWYANVIIATSAIPPETASVSGGGGVVGTGGGSVTLLLITVLLMVVIPYAVTHGNKLQLVISQKVRRRP